MTWFLYLSRHATAYALILVCINIILPAISFYFLYSIIFDPSKSKTCERYEAENKTTTCRNLFLHLANRVWLCFLHQTIICILTLLFQLRFGMLVDISQACRMLYSFLLSICLSYHQQLTSLIASFEQKSLLLA